MTDNVPMIKKRAKKTKIQKLDEIPQECIDFSKYLPKDKYDIHYVISLLQVIDYHCQSKPMSNLGFSLSNSIRRMLAMLETERDQPRDSIIILECQTCLLKDVVLSSNVQNWQCPECAILM